MVEDRGNMWYMGAVPLGVEDDKYWLSELQVYLRANFAEAFAATEEDIAAPMHGRNKPIALGQVGIRCMHCKCTCFRLLWLFVCLFVCHCFVFPDEAIDHVIILCLQAIIQPSEVNRQRRTPV